MLQETSLGHAEIPSRADSQESESASRAVDKPIDMIDVVTLLLRGKRTIFGFVVVTFLLMSVLVFLVLKPVYTAEAVFLPPQSAPGSNLSQAAGQLGALSGIGALGGIKSTGDVYVGLLGSRTISEALIKKFDLQNVYKDKRLSEAAKDLTRNSKFVAGKNTLVTIDVSDHDPRRAADIANGYLDALREQNGLLALTESSQRRLFFEQQLEREKNALADAEVELKKTQEQTGLISPNGQAQAEIETTAQLRAQITNLQVNLAAVKQGATDQNPEVVRLQTQIAGLEQELTRLQSDSTKRQPGSLQLPTARVPELSLEYVRKLRDVKYHDILFELLAKQYEAARLDESRDAPVLQIVDRAVIPDKKSGPPRMLLLLASLILGVLLGAGWVIFRGALEKVKQDPIRSSKLKDLRRAASLKRETE